MGQQQCKHSEQDKLQDEYTVPPQDPVDATEYEALATETTDKPTVTSFSTGPPEEIQYTVQPSQEEPDGAMKREQGSPANLMKGFSSEPLKKNDGNLFQRTKLVAGLSKELAPEVERHIDEMLRNVPEDEKDKARAYLYAVIGFVWHDRDSEVKGLREDQKQELNIMMRSPSKWGFDLDKVCQEQHRLVIVSSNIPHPEMFKECVHKPEWIVEYDHRTTTVVELMQQIDDKAKELKPLTVALANHGTDEEGHWSITKDLIIDVTGTVPKLSPEALDFFKHLAGAARIRVDLLACDLAATPSGLALVQELEVLTGRHFAASTNHTGNLTSGGDWVMESDNVDTAGIYFSSQELYKWEGHLANKKVNTCKLDHKVHKEANCEKAKRQKGKRHSQRRARGEDSASDSDRDYDHMNNKKMFSVYTAADKRETAAEKKERLEREYYRLGRCNA